jgi:hypothetical protein
MWGGNGCGAMRRLSRARVSTARTLSQQKYVVHCFPFRRYENETWNGLPG